MDTLMYWRSNRKSGSPSLKIGSAPYFYFRVASRRFVADSATPITPSVEEFMEYDSVVVLLAVARAYIVKFFVTSH